MTLLGCGVKWSKAIVGDRVLIIYVLNNQLAYIKMTILGSTVQWSKAIIVCRVLIIHILNNQFAYFKVTISGGHVQRRFPINSCRILVFNIFNIFNNIELIIYCETSGGPTATRRSLGSHTHQTKLASLVRLSHFMPVPFLNRTDSTTCHANVGCTEFLVD